MAMLNAFRAIVLLAVLVGVALATGENLPSAPWASEVEEYARKNCWWGATQYASQTRNCYNNYWSGRYCKEEKVWGMRCHWR